MVTFGFWLQNRHPCGRGTGNLQWYRALEHDNQTETDLLLPVWFSAMSLLLLWKPKNRPWSNIIPSVVLSNEQCISLTPESQEDSPPVGLSYSKDEFKDVVSRLLTFFNSEELGLIRYSGLHICPIESTKDCSCHCHIKDKTPSWQKNRIIESDGFRGWHWL